SRWGQGLASELVPAILHHAREGHGIERVIATSDRAHAASHRILENSGMVREGSTADADGRTTITHAIDFGSTTDQA
ncbi:GNAT family N-acetyltransferase, partial [bacterium]|nr:GNAT family N-acetyltransferase [bacterium]